ncbi:DNA-directed RNA polymerase III subunit RPC1 [Trichomonascus vanleenenianus]|uniref:DNA-directed RNA polymerase III core subunit RPO31 n=1 Tax=Trichomonascus vanleenenianus TaxID=2268995 RepID=UPI003ECB6323
MKESVVDDPPRYIKDIDFGVLKPQEIIKESVVEISQKDLYDLTKGRIPYENGAIDTRMGVSNNFSECKTCQGRLATCQGHFGHIRLALPCFHIGYFKQTIGILQNICKDCSAVLLTEQDKRKFLAELRRPGIDNLRRMQILKKINEQCKKQRTCLKCGSINGVVKKVGPLKCIHDKFRWVGKKTPDEKVEFDKSFEEAIKNSNDLEKFLKRAMDDLNPLKVYNLFREIVPSDCELLGMDAAKGRPEMYIWTYIPAPPVCIRPSVMQDTASNEDDLTVKLADVVHASSMIRAGLEKGAHISLLMEQWDFMQLTLALYINADTPSGPTLATAKPIRGLCQRLKGKQGRFRGNLSGKRVDFSGRTVISPDPNLSVDQVAVPDRVAKILTYPERVTQYNREKLKALVSNGPLNHPGANYVLKKNEVVRRNLRYGRKDDIARDLNIGDIVERHLEDGDIVLFNRQPSLHRLSILSHYAKIRPWRTFRLNECVCTPYNADFDGDEMNLHVPQTEEARAEAINLMGVKNNLVTPKSGEPIIAATQDFITGSYLISRKDQFFDRAAFCELLAMMADADLQFDIPPPAIWKPVQLWTGKQIFSLLIKPNSKSNVVINLEAKNKTFHAPPKGYPPEMSPNDGYVVIRGSQVLCGAMDKSTLGDGKKHSVFFAILRDYGPDAAATAMNRMAKMCARWLGNRGFSIGINDVTPGKKLNEMKDDLVELAYRRCEDLIEQLRQGTLQTQPGCNEEQTLEAKIGGLLSKVREEVGDVCIRELEKSNAPLIMATCGSKGSTLNVSQMVAVVGQQIISGSRVPDGFQDRTLPHFKKFSKSPPSKGFVRNSFYSGLTPPEFLFHAISGREGLVDTAVKTAETGYMSRRLMKSLEDLSAQYDETVRTSSNAVVQFNYGGDGLDPFNMEADAKPVDFKRTWEHAFNITFSNQDEGLKPYEIAELAETVLKPREERLLRRDNLGNLVEGEEAKLEEYVDEQDPQRDFYQEVRDFIRSRAEDLGRVRSRRNMQALLERPEGDLADVDLDEFVPEANKIAVNQVYKISKPFVLEFLRLCLVKYHRAKVEPGTAVGPIGAQSIGEPGTQMTLKTFHFAGVASMNVTLGVPRIKEIMNASKTISTPIITAVLQNDEDERVARMIKGRIEKTHLKDIVKYMEDVFMEHNAHIGMRIDWKTVERLRLEVTISDIARAISQAPKLKISYGDVRVIGNDTIHVEVVPPAPGTGKNATSIELEMYYRAQLLRRALPEVVVKGYPEISRAVINIRDKDNKKELLVEGYGLRDVMTTDGIVGVKTTTNHVLEAFQVLGIEAARACIINEIDTTMSSHGMSVDPRHIQLLGDVMTFKGEVLGITRFGLAKMRDSVLQLASFEKTTDHLFDASFYMKTDAIEGVSECIILGRTMSLGTGAFKVVKPLANKNESTKPVLFEELCDELDNE